MVSVAYKNSSVFVRVHLKQKCSELLQDLLPVTQTISNLGGWALLQNAKFDPVNFKWESLAGKLAVIGVSTILNLIVHNSPTNASRHVVTVSVPVF